MKRAYTIASLSIIGGTLAHLMVLLVIHIEGPHTRRPFPEQATIQYIGSLGEEVDAATLEQAALRDSAPLFMPTRWNLVSEMADVASLKEATEIFQPFSAQLLLASTKPLPPVDPSAGEAATVTRLPDGSAFILSRYGRQPAGNLAERSEGTSCTVRLIGAGVDQSGKSLALSDALRSEAPASLWSPVRLFLQLQNGLPVGPPLVDRSSGFRDWDLSLQRFFTRLEFYRAYSDGYYQIWVYP